MKLIDIGANLSHNSFSDDLDEVLERARKAGVDSIVVTGTSLEGSHSALELARMHPGFLFATAGIHPHEADHFSADSIDQLKTLAADPAILALGETGLDFHRNYSTRENQLKAFEAQLNLAVETGLPLFLHQRDAHVEFFELLSRYRNQLQEIVVHCFTGSASELEDYLSLDAYIGITGWVCDERRGSHLHPLIPRIPVQRLLLETDAPYLLPRTISPKPDTRRNEPAYLAYVLKTVSQCLSLPEADVAAQSLENTRRFFRLDQ